MKNLHVKTIEKHVLEEDSLFQTHDDIVWLKHTQEDSYVIAGLKGIHTCFASPKDEPPLDLSKPLSIQYISDVFWIVCSHGTVFTVKENTLECVGSIEQPLLDAKWSPALTELALLAADGTVLLLSQDMQLLSEKHILHDAKKKRENIGWGSTHAQYRGREQDACPMPAPSVQKDTRSSVQWSPDSKTLCVSYWNNAERIVRIYRETGMLLADCESSVYLNAATAWKKPGHVFAASKQNELVFVEQNGLDYICFDTLRKGEVSGLGWNSEGTLLATLQRNDDSTVVGIWLASNHSWNVKKEFLLDRTANVCRVLWSATDPLHMYIQQDRVLRSIHLAQPEYTTSKNGDTAAVHGPGILLSSFANKTIPPPYYDRKLTARSTPLHICFSHSMNELAALHQDSIELFDLGSTSIRTYTHTQEEPIQCSLTRTKIFILSSAQLNNISIIEKEKETEEHRISLSGLTKLLAWEDDVCAAIAKDKEWLIAADGGVVSSFVLEGDEKWSQRHKSGAAAVLYEDGRIQYNGQDLEVGCTSAAMGDGFLVCTTQKNTLLLFDLSATTDSQKKTERPVEMGAEVVLVAEHSSSVLLQMPRGNIERIFPHCMLRHRLASLVAEGSYMAALLLCRTNRLEPSLVALYGGTAFIEAIPALVAAFNSTEKLTHLAISLGKQSAENTLFAQAIQKIRTETEQNKAFYETTIATYVFSVPPMLEEAAAEALRHRGGLEYLSYLVTPKKLFYIFLGLYNTDAALAAIHKTSEDPKEYADLVNGFRSGSPAVLHFRIDNYLGRSGRALLHLLQTQEAFSVVLEYAVQKAILPQLLKAVKTCAQRESVYCAMAQAEEEKGNINTASLLFRCGNNNQAAYRLALLSLNWRRVFEITGEAGTEVSQQDAQLLLDGLKAQQKYAEAYDLCLEGMSSPEAAFATALEGKLWRQACYLSLKYKDAEKRQKMEEKMEKETGIVLEKIKETRNTIQHAVGRFPVACEKNSSRIKSLLGAETDSPKDTTSLKSIQTTNTQKSIISALSFRHRKPAKKLSNKPGSWHETEYLLRTAASCIESLNGLLFSLDALVETLLLLHKHHLVCLLQNSCCELEAFWMQSKSVFNSSYIVLDTSTKSILQFSSDVKNAIEEYSANLGQIYSQMPVLGSFPALFPYL